MRLNYFLVLLFVLPCLSYAAIQTKPIVVNQALVNKISALAPDSSNAHTIELMIGAPSACLPLSAEAWICQWKNNLISSGIQNTLNISFESGMVTTVLGVNKEGTFLSKKK